MPKVSLNDIVALAKAGFSVSEVKELISMGNQEAESEPNKAEEPREQPGQVPEKPNTEKEPEGETLQEHDNKELDELRKQNAELLEQLKKAQASHNHQDFSDRDATKSSAETLGDIVRKFM